MQEGKNWRFTAADSWCCQNLKNEKFTSSFGRLSQKIATKSVPRVQNDYFSSLNQSYNSFGRWGRRCRLRYLNALSSPTSSLLSPSSLFAFQKSFIILLPPFHMSGLESSLSGLLQSVPWYPLGSPPLKSRLTGQEDTEPVRTGEPAQRKTKNYQNHFYFVCTLGFYLIICVR